MEDEQIIELYINRDERAIKETKDKYGSWIFNTASAFPFSCRHSSFSAHCMLHCVLFS